jgi:hypothetical protein
MRTVKSVADLMELQGRAPSPKAEAPSAIVAALKESNERAERAVRAVEMAVRTMASAPLRVMPSQDGGRKWVFTVHYDNQDRITHIEAEHE